MKKTIPTFNSDREAEDFVGAADLGQYDLSGGQVMRFDSNARASLRLPARSQSLPIGVSGVRRIAAVQNLCLIEIAR